MPRAGQIIPKYSFSHIETYLNDNTERSETVPNSYGEVQSIFVFPSPKGIDGEIITNKKGLAGLLRGWGAGSAALYGQAYMNAYTNAATGQTTQHLLRIAAENATYANTTVYALYKVDTEGDPKLKVQFKSVSVSNVSKKNMFETIAKTSIDTIVPPEGYEAVRLFTIFYRGKGEYGNSLLFRLSHYTEFDAENKYKNYLFELYEAGTSLSKLEEFPVVFVDEAEVDEVSLYPESVINDPDSGSEFVEIHTNIAGFEKLYDTWLEKVVVDSETELTIENFDVLLGVDKLTNETITGYEIDTQSEGTFVLNALTGVALSNGTDGDFSASTPEETRKAALEKAYIDAFSGLTNERIKSRKRFPSNIMFDANYPLEAKKQLASLITQRGDGMACFDMGTALLSKKDPIDYDIKFGEFISQRLHMVDAYWAKVKDPVSKKHVKVTSTYFLASMYPIHFGTYGAKHIPLAGSNYGVLSGYDKNTVTPLYDEDIDADIMDQLEKKQINFASVTSKNEIIRHNQTTRQNIISDLSEANAVFVTLDVKRDVEAMCEQNSYKFSDPAQMAVFNADVEVLLSSYQNQVDEVQAYFDKSEWESENNIVHLYVNIVHKDIVKTTLIEIDLNK